MSNGFTERSQRVILIAQEEAKRLNHDYVGTEHILLGIICLGEGVAAVVLANMGVDLRKVRDGVEKIVGTGDNVMLLGEIPFTPRAKKVLEFAVEEAASIGSHYVGTEHLLLGCLREEEGVASRVLTNLGLKLLDVRTEVLHALHIEPLLADPPPAKCSCHPVLTVDKITALIYELAEHHVPLGTIRDAARKASGIRYDAMRNPHYAPYRQLAETFLEI